tara:strand:- start:330 stop:1238 length:909 start_codon:yes stop_codon:yes gene_type:complete
MSRNNEDRFAFKGAEDPTAALAAQQEQLKNLESETEPAETAASAPAMTFTTPTEFIDLPSKGLYYLEGHPLHGKDCIEVRHMTAKDEDILSSTTLLKKGLAIDRLLRNVIVDKTLTPDHLLIGDKNAVLIGSRITGYGTDYDASITCPSCASTLEHSFDLIEASKVYHGDDFKTYDIEKTKKGTFVITLPATKAKVEVRLLSGLDERNLEALAKNRKKHRLPETTMTNQFKTYIVSVNKERKETYINSFIENMPARDSRYLRSAYERVIPNVTLKEEFTCSECGFDTDIDVPFTVTFFWPNE